MLALNALTQSRCALRNIWRVLQFILAGSRSLLVLLFPISLFFFFSLSISLNHSYLFISIGFLIIFSLLSLHLSHFLHLSLSPHSLIRSLSLSLPIASSRSIPHSISLPDSLSHIISDPLFVSLIIHLPHYSVTLLSSCCLIVFLIPHRLYSLFIILHHHNAIV